MRDSSKDGSKTPRFFCESCGAEVPGSTKTCPGCGKRFASVLCPSCGFTGAESSFREGCPVCGYSSGESGKPAPKKAVRNFQKDSPRPNTAGALPFWVYVLTALAFAAILAALFFETRN